MSGAAICSGGTPCIKVNRSCSTAAGSAQLCRSRFNHNRTHVPRLGARQGLRNGRQARGNPICSASSRPDVGMGLLPELRAAIEKFNNMHPVVLYMKGTREFPQCGFSNTCVQILNSCGVEYETVNILEDDRLRSGMKEYSQWPTFPQVYIGGEFFGGCDIMIEAYQKGELVETLEAARNG